MTTTFETKFNLQDRVVINGERNGIVATVQRLQISGVGVTYEVSWFDASGTFKEHWLYEWQLELAS